MIIFWVVVAVVFIVLGLFIFTQGGQNFGPAITTVGVVILLILLVSPARSHYPGARQAEIISMGAGRWAR